ncbi:sensor histidine kinase [Paenibacillus rigui]|uniref:sensor histidine kinase n=1 Tax=Paenibacillus rigui TaxID=554312 RepID=UPI0015C5A7B1|nr:sensor histidine kinase [Paenibacillus rigui]
MSTIQIARWGVAGISVGCAAMYAVAVPHFFRELRDHCVYSECMAFYSTPPGQEWLVAHGITPTVWALAYTLLYVVFSLLYFTAGAALFAKKRNDAIGLLGAFTLINLGSTFIPVMDVLKQHGPFLKLGAQSIAALGMAGFIMFYGMFPNGRFTPRWTGWLLGTIIVLRIPGMLAPGTWIDIQSSFAFFLTWFIVWIGSLLVLVVYRYRVVLSPMERLQTKWAIYGLVVALGGLAGWTAAYLVNKPAWDANPYLLYVLEVGVHGSMCAIPVTLLVALMRFRLWNIDPIVNRTLVYGVLTTCIVVLYGGTVGYLGLMFQTSGSWVVSLVATGLVAVLFHPLRLRLQRVIDRWMYGERGDPVATLTDLGERLAEPMSPEEVLLAVARSVREALRLSYVGISVRVGPGDLDMPIAEDGPVPLEIRYVPLVHRGERVGTLHVPSLPGTSGEIDRGHDGWTASDRRFLDLLSRQASAIVHGVQATYAVQRLAADLQESRERLVLAREEERRRLRHNLHDDLAPRLAALLYTSSAAEHRVDTEPTIAKSMIAELRGHIRRTITDIRTLVYDLRPPALDELGLVGAIGERIADLKVAARGLAPQAGASPLHIELDAPEVLPPLPAAVEVAAYRIATEALVNVTKHAFATRCMVALRVADGKLELTIRDDGVGTAKPMPMEPQSQTRIGGGGLGKASMRERAAELGGFCGIERLAEGGTIVRAWLPYGDADSTERSKTMQPSERDETA